MMHERPLAVSYSFIFSQLKERVDRLYLFSYFLKKEGKYGILFQSFKTFFYVKVFFRLSLLSDSSDILIQSRIY